MSYNYSAYFNALTSLLVAADTNGQANLNAMLPNIIDYAEQRIYRELDLLTTLTPLISTTTANTRFLAVPASAVVVQSVNFITPANTSPDNGTRNTLRRTSVEFINYTWPSASMTSGTPSIPEYCALQNRNTNITSTTFSQTGSNYTLLMAPAPDSTYVVEFLSTVRPAPLSPSNPYTFLTVTLPDLFLAASMVFASGFQRDFGAQSDDPKMAVSWEDQYKTLKESANIEELRKKSESSDWNTLTPSPLESQPR